jgi:hypothetical protein
MKIKKKQIAKKCIFCGAGNLSKEHFWPVWASAFLPKYPNNQRAEQTISAGLNHRFDARSDVKHRPGHTWNKTIRVVCISCNNGWMSEIESLAQPILTPLILGQNFVINSNNATIIARWITLKVMVGEQNQPENCVITADQRTKFFSSFEIPDNLVIWIARCGVDGWESAYWRHAATVSLLPFMPKNRSKNMHSVAFGIGDLFIYVVHANVTGISLDDVFRIEGSAFKLYPFIKPILWPPNKSLTAENASRIAHAFNDLLSSNQTSWQPLPRGL